MATACHKDKGEERGTGTSTNRVLVSEAGIVELRYWMAAGGK